MSGAQVVYNRHHIQKNLSDQYATLQAYQAINHDNDIFENTNIAITTFNNEMLIAGQVPKQYQKRKVEVLVKNATDVGEIHNALTISNPSSSLTRMSDAWITAKVKAKMLASDDLDASLIKVVTENGVVYLMGVVPPSEAQAAVTLASETQGVSRVVKVFKYIRISRA